MDRTGRACSIRGDAGRAVRLLLAGIGDRWGLLTLATLDGEPLRFGELLTRVPGVSQRMLTRTLRQLERDGLVSRTSYPEVPPRVEYALTATGQDLIGPAADLADWAAAHGPGIEASRAAYDARSSGAA
ncbi:MAG TPA: helix-turn-helix domain-containing protein [Cellulomonas sp.]